MLRAHRCTKRAQTWVQSCPMFDVWGKESTTPGSTSCLPPWLCDLGQTAETHLKDGQCVFCVRCGVVPWDYQCEGPAPGLAHSGGSAHLSSAVRKLLPSAVLTFTNPEFVPLPQALKVTGGISRSQVSIRACTSSPSSASSGPYPDHYFYTRFFKKSDKTFNRRHKHTLCGISSSELRKIIHAARPGTSGTGQSKGPWPHPGSAVPFSCCVTLGGIYIRKGNTLQMPLFVFCGPFYDQELFLRTCLFISVKVEDGAVSPHLGV